MRARPVLGAVGLGALVVGVLEGRRRQLRFGATAAEVGSALPGDDLIDRPGLTATRAVTIAAPAQEVWPWLVQLGQQRAGFYSYEALENLFGCDIHNADRVVPEWQDLAVGDEVRLHPDGGLTVAAIDPGRALVLEGGVDAAGPPAPFSFTWAFVLHERPDGSTRLVVRERYRYLVGWAPLVVEPVQLASFVMTQRMLRGIRDRAEHRPAAGAGGAFARAYRRTGADLPNGDPVPSHGSEMEGWFWRVTDPSTGRVVVALCGVNRHPAGDWATVAVALHPGGIVRAAALDDAHADRTRFALRAGTGERGRIEASGDRLRVDLDGVHLDLHVTEKFEWPKAFGGGGVFSAVPFLNQYWHPYRLGGTAAGSLVVDGVTIDGVTIDGATAEPGTASPGTAEPGRWSLDGATVYCERNWGAGFPDRWWWGQAHDFDGADVSVAFSGGLLRLGPIARDVAGVVVRLGDRVIRITPPWPVRSAMADGRWTLRARTRRYRIDLEGDGTGLEPHVLPVPLPSERRNADTDFEHLAGRLHCVVRERGRIIFDGTSELAGLEVGYLPGLA